MSWVVVRSARSSAPAFLAREGTQAPWTLDLANAMRFEDRTQAADLAARLQTCYGARDPITAEPRVRFERRKV